MCLGSLFTKISCYKSTGMIKYFGIDNYNMGIIHIIDISSKDKDINHNGKFLISIIFYYSLLNYSFDFDQNYYIHASDYGISILNNVVTEYSKKEKQKREWALVE
ncbi:hypothetical protein BDF21DRAFT_403532 [Thamnidium elegans]|nr:hypothetical protein BDF21DRAFT_403532 [Thamnidium elegans]